MMNFNVALVSRILLLLFMGEILGCNDEKNQISPRNPEDIILNYDSENLSAPTLDPGNYEGAARFSADQISQLSGAQLIEVWYFTALVPDQCQVKIYSGNSPGAPGAVLYSADVTSTTQPATWNVHELAAPVIITGQDVWVSFAFEISNVRATLGCDAGPAFENGDWLYSNTDNLWRPLSQRTPIDINWNIRAVVRL